MQHTAGRHRPMHSCERFRVGPIQVLEDQRSACGACEQPQHPCGQDGVGPLVNQVLGRAPLRNDAAKIWPERLQFGARGSSTAREAPRNASESARNALDGFPATARPPSTVIPIAMAAASALEPNGTCPVPLGRRRKARRRCPTLPVPTRRRSRSTPRPYPPVPGFRGFADRRHPAAAVVPSRMEVGVRASSGQDLA